MVDSLEPKVEPAPPPIEVARAEQYPAPQSSSNAQPMFASLGRMEVKRDPTSAAISLVINIALIAFFLWFGARQIGIIAKAPAATVTILDPPPPPPRLPPKAVLMGGGGGQKGTPIVKGNPPKFAEHQIVPPNVPPLEQPKIKIDPTVVVQTDLKMAHSNVPTLGMPNSPLVGVAGMGGGKGTGFGSGSGNGLGPGTGGNYGGGLRKIGGGVSRPEVLYQPEPEFSEEARKAKVAGNVLVGLIIDANGHPQSVHVLRGIGLGLDEKAVEAVQKYKFKPAMENGHAVPVQMQVEVNFQIF